MHRHLEAALLGAGGLLAMTAGTVDAGRLEPLRCELVRAPEATCQWAPEGTCTWEEGGTPAVCAPVTGPIMRLRPAGTYHGGYFNASASASVAYDGHTQRMLVANVAAQAIDVIDLRGAAVSPRRPARLAKTFSIDVAALLPALAPGSSAIEAPRGAAAPRHLALRDDGLLAAVLQNVQDATLPGRVALFQAGGSPATPPIAIIDAGFMPARAAFTPDGAYLLIANEGEPSDDYRIDPPGLVTIVDLTNGPRRATASNVGFHAFDPFKQWLVRRGVRITGPNLATADPSDTASVADDVEPADIAISPDSRLAWITLPESNAVAVLDIRRKRFLGILPFGAKDHARQGNALDPTDNDGDRATTNGIPGINIENWPISGMYMARRVALDAAYWLPVLVYPSEGTRRSYTAFMDEIRLDDPALTLDPVTFPPAVQQRLQAIRLKVSRVDGDKDGDGDVDRIYAFGGRSFSLRLPDNRLVYDSGDDFERITAQAAKDTYGAVVPGRPYFLFNTPDDENSLDQDSDLRGPEPFAVATGTVGRRTYAFIGLERVGGIMAYDITDPFRARFAYYVNDRNFALDPKSVCSKGGPETDACANVGTLSPEDLVFVPRRDSPVGAPLLLASHATSGSASVYVIDLVDR